MPCYSPIDAYRTPHGEIKFSRRSGSTHIPLPCGKCIGCKIRRSQDWAVRCVHESQFHEQNMFITLTYDDEYLPNGNTLIKKHVQDFIKRFRTLISPKRIRYFACGEYGEKSGRAHYHIILFGYEFDDKFPHQRGKNYTLYRSPTLEKLWPFGNSNFSDVNYSTALYCTLYAGKNILTEEQLGDRLKPFLLMSKKPPIGRGYFEKYKRELLQHDNVVINGRTFALPRAYDKSFDEQEREMLSDARRERNSKRSRTRSKLRVSERVKILSSPTGKSDIGE